jgi:hypothetical protein
MLRPRSGIIGFQEYYWDEDDIRYWGMTPEDVYTKAKPMQGFAAWRELMIHRMCLAMPESFTEGTLEPGDERLPQIPWQSTSVIGCQVSDGQYRNRQATCERCPQLFSRCYGGPCRATGYPISDLIKVRRPQVDTSRCPKHCWLHEVQDAD